MTRPQAWVVLERDKPLPFLGTTGCETEVLPGIADVAVRAMARHPAIVLVDADCVRCAAAARELEALRDSLRAMPVVLVAQPQTPPALIERCWRAGIDGCARDAETAAAMMAWVATFHGDEAVRFADRRRPRVVCVVGEQPPRSQRVRQLLELGGYHVFEAPRSGRPPIRPDVVVWFEPEAPQGGRAPLKGGPGLQGLEEVPVIVVGHGHNPLPWSTGEQDWVNASEPADAVLQRVRACLEPSPDPRRFARRMPLFRPVEVRAGSLDAPWLPSFSFDFTPRGVFLRTLLPFSPGASLRLRIDLDGYTVDAGGVVAWVNRYGARRSYAYPLGMGVSLEALSDPDRNRLEELYTLRC